MNWAWSDTSSQRLAYGLSLWGMHDRDDLFRIIGIEAGEQMSLLPLVHERFLENTKMQAGDLVTSPPARVCDAFITYPRVTILESRR